jgi:hypothetical protein
MPKICYQPHVFSPDRLALIEKCDQICQSYAAQGYDLTLRQLHYRLVTQDLYPDDRRWLWTGKAFVRDANGTKNAQPNYKWLGDLLADARMAGLIHWDIIVDRTRSLMGNRHWKKPSDLVQEASKNYAINKWENQEHYLEAWVEKDALEGVIGRICQEMDVPFFSCRGYTSLSSMWEAGQRLLERLQKGKTIHIIHLGDHDPSGLDMSRDIKERLDLFIGAHMKGEKVHVLRVALNMPQIERLNLPPSPTKGGDSRTPEYEAKYGEDTWELDALEPAELSAIVERAVKMYRNETLWDKAVKLEQRGRKTLEAIFEGFPDVVKFLRGEIV